MAERWLSPVVVELTDTDGLPGGAVAFPTLHPYLLGDGWWSVVDGVDRALPPGWSAKVSRVPMAPAS